MQPVAGLVVADQGFVGHSSQEVADMRNVRIISESGTKRKAQVLDEDGTPIRGITAIDVRLRPDEFVTATMEMAMVDLTLSAAACFLMVHPETGELTEVREIHFADGSKVHL